MTKLSLLAKTTLLAVTIFLPVLAFAQEDPNKWLKDLATISIWPLAPIIMLAMVCVTDIIKERRRSKLIEKFINSGQEIPPELLIQFKTDNKFQSKNTKSPEQEFRQDMGYGIGFLCFGLGLGLTLSLIFEPKTGLWGLIFIFISLACFLNAIFISGKALKQEEKPAA